MKCPFHEKGLVRQIVGVGEKRARRLALKNGIIDIEHLRIALMSGRPIDGIDTKGWRSGDPESKLRKSIVKQLVESDSLASQNNINAHKLIPPGVGRSSPGMAGGDVDIPGVVGPVRPTLGDAPPELPPGPPPPKLIGPGDTSEPIFGATTQTYPGKYLYELTRLNPELRILQHPNPRARDLFARLVTPNWRFDENAAGTPTPVGVQSKQSQHRLRVEHAFESLDKIFRQYQLGLEPDVETPRLTIRQKTGVVIGRAQSRLGQSDKLTRQRFEEEVTRALGRRDAISADVPPDARAHIEAAADEYREFLLDIEKLRKENGFFSSIDGRDYLPYVYNHEAIVRDPQGFERDVLADLKEQINGSSILSPAQKAEALDIAEAAVPGYRNNVEMTSHERVHETFQEWYKNPANRASRERTGGIIRLEELPGWEIRPRFETIENYLVRDLRQVMSRYLNSSVIDLEMKIEFDDADASGRIAAVIDSMEPMREELLQAARDRGASPYEINSINRNFNAKQVDQLRTDLQGIVSQLRGQNVHASDPYSMGGTWERSLSVLRSVTNITKSGNFVFAALGDTASIAIEHSIGRTYRTIFGEFRDGMDVIAREHSDADFRALRIGFADSTRRRTSFLTGMNAFPQMGITKFERVLHGWGSNAMVLNGLLPWTNWIKHVGARIVLTRIIDDGVALRDGTAHADVTTRLNAAHISEENAIRIADLWSDPEIGGGGSDVKWLNMQAWGAADQDLIDLIRASIARDVERIVPTPGVQDVPLYIHTHEGKTLLQYRAFGLSHTNRVLVNSLQRHAAGDSMLVQGVGASVSMGAMSYILRELTGKREIPTDPMRILQEGIVRSDLLGAFGEFDSALSGLSGGLWGVRGMIAPDTYYGGRYYSSDLLSMGFGVNASTAKEFPRAMRAIFSDSPSDRDAVAPVNFAPGRSLFWLDWVYDGLSDSLVESNQQARQSGR